MKKLQNCEDVTDSRDMRDQLTERENDLEFTMSTPVTEFYANKSVFITGGTGFLGLVLIEKLLYSCDRIKNLYVLIRPKKGKTVADRLVDLLSSPAIQRLKKQKPKVLNKIIPINGDVCEPDLGINAEEQAMLFENVSIVFHVAADVNLNSPLKSALNRNTKGTQYTLRLSHKMSHLQAFVYISSAFSNSHRDLVAEKVYPTEAPLDCVFHMAEHYSENSLTERLLENRPNTYTYAKALAEELIVNERRKIPTAIVRPSIILSAVSEPVTGWVDGWTGANGMTVAIGQGVLRSWPAEPDFILDIIPVDMVANLIIAVAWDTHMRSSRGEQEVKVYNCTSGLQNPLTVKNFMKTCLRYSSKLFNKVLCYPTLIVSNNKLMDKIVIFLLQIIPAFFIDGINMIFNVKSGMMKIQQRVLKLRSVIEYFTFHQFTFLDQNMRSLYSAMDPEDKRIFNFDVKSINWDSYLETYVIGLRKYLLKEGLENTK